MKIKKIIAFTVILGLILTAMPIVPNAAISTSTSKNTELYPITHKGINWKLAQAVIKKTVTDDKDTEDTSDDTKTVTITDYDEIAYINDSGNLYCSTENRRILASSVPYGLRVYSKDNADNMFCESNFRANHEFEMKFKFTDAFYIMFYNGSYRHYVQFYNESELHYNDSEGRSYSLEIDAPWNKWHTLKLTSTNSNIGAIYLNGKKIAEYKMEKTTTAPYFMIATYHHIDATAAIEVEYAKLTPVNATVSEAPVDENTATITVPDTVNYGETIDVSIDTNIPSSDIKNINYYANGNVLVSTAATTASLLGLRAGTAAISAKIICKDGREYRTETKYVNVDKGAVSGNVSMSREYILDYDFDGTTGSVTVNDGYFRLAFEHSGNTVTYATNTGASKTYTGEENGIGAGAYRVVATAGNAEVYYNGHFLFSCLMPYVNNNVENISLSGGISNTKLQSSGVKAERYSGEWTSTDAIEVYDLDFGMFYSLEFNKENSDDETIVIYDGEYQAKLVFDERGITAMAQPEDYRVPEEFNLTNEIGTGYYRLTVARGIAQLFLNNKYINSFKCPVNPHAKAVLRSAVASSGRRFISVKNTDDVYFHNEDFEGNTEYNANEYWFSEHEGRALKAGENDPFTQEIVTENGNSYLKIKDSGLVKEQYTGYANNSRISQPVGDWNINASPDNPVFNFRAKADGTGEIHFLARHYQKGFFTSVSYSFTDQKWYLNRYSLLKESFSAQAKLVVPASDFGITDTVDDKVNISAIYAMERKVLAESADNPPGTDWNNYKMVLKDNYIALYCNDTKIIEYSNLVSGHGKMGFGVAYGAALCIDDVEYAGNSRQTLALKYVSTGDAVDAGYTFYTGNITTEKDGTQTKDTVSNTGFRANHGSEDFHKSPVNGVVASSADYYSWKTLDGGNTWQPAYKVYTDNDFEIEHSGHYFLYYTGTSSLNLLSGMYMRIGSVNWAKPSIGEEVPRLYSSVHPEGDYKSTAQINGSWAKENMVVDPPDFPSEIYNQSNIASQLVQVQDGDYKGRIFMSKTIGGERYGGDAIFYTDVDRDFMQSGASVDDYWDRDTNKMKKILDDVWYLAGHTLTYESIGFDIQESKVVDMPNSVLRAYGRGDTGFISYCESYDGGETWEKGVPSQFIAPRCSYGVVRDPQNLNHYYAFWCYEANTSDKKNDGGRPRTRQALAGSFDGGETWQYLADVEELTNDWRKGHDGSTGMGTPQNHGLRVIDGVIYMSYGGFNGGTGYSKLYTLNTAKVKPLMRFSEVHDKRLFYYNGAQALTENCAVIPKTTGKGKVYGTTTNITVADGNYDAATIAKIMNAISYGSGTFNVDGEDVTLTPDANGNFDIIEAAEAFDKKVVETEHSYIVSNTSISRVDSYYLEGIGIQRTAAEDISADFLNQFNLAVEYSKTDNMVSLLDEYSDLLDFEVDTSKEEIFEKMLGYTYYSIDDIGKIYTMACTAEEQVEGGEETPLVLSTVSNGFEGWDTIADGGAATADTLDDTAAVATVAPYSNASEYGTASFEIPDCDTYALNFDVKVDGSSEANIKWGNASHLMQIALNAANNAGFEIENDKIPLTVTADKWYNICVLVSKAAYGRNAIVKMAEIADDGTVGDYTEYTFDGITGTAGRKGFWLETANGGSASLKKVRLYTDETIEVLSFIANGGKASATVEYLNLDAELAAGQAVMNIFNNNIFAGSGYSEELTEAIPVLGTKKIVFTDVTYDIKTGVNPVAKFHMWKDTLNLQPLAKPVENVSMKSEFTDDFSGAALDAAKWSISTDGDGDATALFAGISDEEGGVLKLSKTTSGTLDFKAKLPAQSDNMVVSYDFKVNALNGALFQQQWFGSLYDNTDGTKALDRLVYYIQDDESTGEIELKCGSNYTLTKGVWYSLIVTMSGVGGSREYKFYIKERGEDSYERLWSSSVITGKAESSSGENSFRFFEGTSNAADMSFDNLKIFSGTFTN